MACSCAIRKEGYDNWQCTVSGDECVYWTPNAKRCAEEYGEGPMAGGEQQEENEND